MEKVLLYVITMDEIVRKESELKRSLDAATLKKIYEINSEKHATEKLGSSYLIANFTGEGEIRYGENGKPFKGSVQFNVSHDNGLVVLCSSDKKVGVDVCGLKRFERQSSHRVFQKEELDQLKNVSDLSFFWAQKESLIKCEGGSVVSIGRVPIGDGERIFDGKRYFSRTFTVMDCAVCVTREGGEEFEIQQIRPLK